MAQSSYKSNPRLCNCPSGSNVCGNPNFWFVLDANPVVNSGNRSWIVTASISLNIQRGWKYWLTLYNTMLGGQNIGTINAPGWIQSPGIQYVSRTVASGTYDNNGNPSQSSVTVNASGTIIPYADACRKTSGGAHNMATSVTVSIPRIAALNRPPSIPTGAISSSNPDVYKLTSSISGIDWGLGYTNPSLTCVISYTLDGQSYSWTAGSWSGGSSRSISVDGMALAPSAPWTRVPEDATVTIRWTASTSVGSATLSKTQYCQTQYEAYVITPGDVIPADLIVSNKGSAPNPNLTVRRIATIK